MFFKLPIHKSYCKSITKNLEIIVYFPPTIPTTYKTAHATLTLLQSTKVFSFEKLTGISIYMDVGYACPLLKRDDFLRRLLDVRILIIPTQQSYI